MKWISDPTRRFSRRPLYETNEIDAECEGIVTSYFRNRGIEAQYPLPTSVLSKLLEQYTDRCDFGKDLTSYGDDVEGLTQFFSDRKPTVFISVHLRDTWLENRRRMTMAHELGHVRFHNMLYQAERSLELFTDATRSGPTFCKRSTISLGGDWMEWQAGYAGGAFLMPISVLHTIASDSLSKMGVSAPLRHDSPEALSLTSTICTQFQVSGEAAAVRLLQQGYIEPRRVESLRFSYHT
jgi:Zn-dependent peptidase ImmA (M78 family)